MPEPTTSTTEPAAAAPTFPTIERLRDLLAEIPDPASIDPESVDAETLDRLAAIEAELVDAFAAARSDATTAEPGDRLAAGLLVSAGIKSLRAITASINASAEAQVAETAEAIATGRGPSLRAAAARRRAITPGAPVHRSGLDAEAITASIDGAWRSTQVDGQYRAVGWRTEYPEARQLTGDAGHDAEHIAAVLGPRALTAAGGVCAPAQVDYAIPVVSGDHRPIRDSLPGFQALRGSVQYTPPPVITDVLTDTTGAAITTWTAATDLSPGGAVKTSQVVTCPSSTTATVDAIVNSLTFGNFAGRFYPEVTGAWAALALAAAARLAELKLWNAMWAAGVAAYVPGDGLGASRVMLDTVERAANHLLTRHRIEPGTRRVAAILPDYVRAMMRADVADSLAHDPAQLVQTDATIAAWFFARGVSVTWTPDVGVPAKQASGGHLGTWPTTAPVIVYVEGTFAFLDAGTLDLGVVRDSTLNAVNRFQLWSETFEGLMQPGPVEALSLTVPLCVNGASAGTVVPALCAS